MPFLEWTRQIDDPLTKSDQPADVARGRARAAQSGEAGIPGALGQLAPGCIPDQLVVPVHRLGQVEKDLQHAMQVGRGQQVEPRVT